MFLFTRATCSIGGESRDKLGTIVLGDSHQKLAQIYLGELI
ncbi:hypothetical protein RRSWK_06351 [Rhodopirellula sp. SWK7]|nr:hypothetical protein RRSWK_06351 [Rhodopirellula sp. SWK7]